MPPKLSNSKSPDPKTVKQPDSKANTKTTATVKPVPNAAVKPDQKNVINPADPKASIKPVDTKANVSPSKTIDPKLVKKPNDIKGQNIGGPTQPTSTPTIQNKNQPAKTDGGTKPTIGKTTAITTDPKNLVKNGTTNVPGKTANAIITEPKNTVKPNDPKNVAKVDKVTTDPKIVAKATTDPKNVIKPTTTTDAKNLGKSDLKSLTISGEKAKVDDKSKEVAKSPEKDAKKPANKQLSPDPKAQSPSKSPSKQTATELFNSIFRSKAKTDVADQSKKIKEEEEKRNENSMKTVENKDEEIKSPKIVGTTTVVSTEIQNGSPQKRGSFVLDPVTGRYKSQNTITTPVRGSNTEMVQGDRITRSRTQQLAGGPSNSKYVRDPETGKYKIETQPSRSHSSHKKVQFQNINENIVIPCDSNCSKHSHENSVSHYSPARSHDSYAQKNQLDDLVKAIEELMELEQEEVELKMSDSNATEQEMEQYLKNSIQDQKIQIKKAESKLETQKLKTQQSLEKCVSLQLKDKINQVKQLKQNPNEKTLMKELLECDLKKQKDSLKETEQNIKDEENLHELMQLSDDEKLQEYHKINQQTQKQIQINEQEQINSNRNQTKVYNDLQQENNFQFKIKQVDANTVTSVKQQMNILTYASAKWLTDNGYAGVQVDDMEAYNETKQQQDQIKNLQKKEKDVVEKAESTEQIKDLLFKETQKTQRQIKDFELKKDLLETNIYNLNCMEKDMSDQLDNFGVKKEAVWEKVWQKNSSLQIPI